MRAVLGLFLVSPVVPMYTVPMCAVPRPLRCPPSSAASPPIVMRFGGGDRSDVQTNQMILRKEQRNVLIVAKSLESLQSLSVFALVYTGVMVVAGEVVSPIQLGALAALVVVFGAGAGLADSKDREIELLLQMDIRREEAEARDVKVHRPSFFSTPLREEAPVDVKFFVTRLGILPRIFDCYYIAVIKTRATLSAIVASPFSAVLQSETHRRVKFREHSLVYPTPQ